MVVQTTAQYAREIDRLADGEQPDAEPIDLDPLLGVWHNANHLTHGISRVDVSERDGRVRVHAWAVHPTAGQTYDWGDVPADGVYTDGPRSRRACGFRATFELGHATTQIQVNVLHSVAVCAAFTTFTDGSSRSDYFSREFLHRREPDRAATEKTVDR